MCLHVVPHVVPHLCVWPGLVRACDIANVSPCCTSFMRYNMEIYVCDMKCVLFMCLTRSMSWLVRACDIANVTHERVKAHFVFVRACESRHTTYSFVSSRSNETHSRYHTHERVKTHVLSHTYMSYMSPIPATFVCGIANVSACSLIFARECGNRGEGMWRRMCEQHTATHCITLQHTATHRNTLPNAILHMPHTCTRYRRQ